MSYAMNDPRETPEWMLGENSMSATDYRKLVMTNGGGRFINVECANGTTVALMISDMSGYAPVLNANEIDELINALVEAKQAM